MKIPEPPPPPPTPKPKPSLCRQVYESDMGNPDNKCSQCGSSQKFSWFGLGSSQGCIHPDCSNYYKNFNEYFYCILAKE